jgi:hypothetical protein
MFARELSDGSFLMIEQEDHTDLAAQFAAHWGNQEFSRPQPYRSVVFGTIYHDSGHREMEADLPIDTERGVPYAIGRTPPGLRKNEADMLNSRWIQTRDPYASLLVTMHHAGLRKRRYDTVRGGTLSNSEPPGAETLGVEDAFRDLPDWAADAAQQLGLTEPSARAAFWHNYQLLQVYGLLSLYFCRDGFERGRMQATVLERVPVASGSDEVVDLRLEPTGPDSLRVTPYPLDVPKLSVSMMTRVLAPSPDQPEPVVQEAYYRATRTPFTWHVTS